MKTPQLVTQFEYVDRVLKKCSSTAKDDEELASYLSSYLVVMLSGIYEDCVEHLFSLRAEKAGDPELSSYVRKTLHASFRNPKFEKIVEVLGKFGKHYADELKNGVQDRNKQALDSIVNNKNQIAHGGRSQVTLGEVLDFHHNTLPIFEALEKILT